MLQQGVFQNHQTTKKFVKVCLHTGQAVQMSLQFDESFDKKKSFKNSNFANLGFSLKTCWDTL